jgi:hypothetical protein
VLLAGADALGAKIRNANERIRTARNTRRWQGLDLSYRKDAFALGLAPTPDVPKFRPPLCPRRGQEGAPEGQKQMQEAERAAEATPSSCVVQNGRLLGTVFRTTAVEAAGIEPASADAPV